MARPIYPPLRSRNRYTVDIAISRCWCHLSATIRIHALLCLFLLLLPIICLCDAAGDSPPVTQPSLPIAARLRRRPSVFSRGVPWRRFGFQIFGAKDTERAHSVLCIRGGWRKEPDVPPLRPLPDPSINHRSGGERGGKRDVQWIEVYEHEWDEQIETTIPGEIKEKWSALPRGQRWFTSTGARTISPAGITAPSEWEWSSPWSIDVSRPSSGINDTAVAPDRQGWIYFRDVSGRRRRRRRWLRTIRPVAGVYEPPLSLALKTVSTPKNVTDAKNVTPSPAALVRSRMPLLSSLISPVLSLFSAVRSDFNFKGFGYGFYKSYLQLNSGGFSFRVPLSANFDALESRPAIPLVSSTFALYYPWTIAAFLSISVHVEVIKYILRRLRNVLLLQWNTTVQPMRFGQVSHRISMGASWRYTEEYGYRFRISPSMSYVPTLESIVINMVEFLVGAIEFLTRVGSRKQGKDEIKNSSRWRGNMGNWGEWMQKRTAMLGPSVGFYQWDNMYHPTGSMMLFLNGFYYPKLWQSIVGRRRIVTTEPLKTSTLKENSKAISGSMMIDKRKNDSQGKLVNITTASVDDNTSENGLQMANSEDKQLGLKKGETSTPPSNKKIAKNILKA